MQVRHFTEHVQVSKNSMALLQKENLVTGKQIILFIILGLIFGGILRQISSLTKIPYTPLILVFGISLGYFQNYIGFFGKSAVLISNIHPSIMLLIFIPVLIFQSSFNCEWHVFRKSIWNIVTLAGPGVFLGAILTALAFKLILGYTDQQMTWYEAMVLGCVLSATDPVAVVALLKQLGASIRFNTLVQGESLLNDGTSMVFFSVFLNLAKGESQTFGSAVLDFTRTALGGPAFGIICGIIISFWLKKIIRDPVLSINITFAGAYLSFYIAQFTQLNVSGVLTVVVLGLYMSSSGRHNIHPDTEKDMHNVWSYIQYIGETLIFVITGVIVGIRMTEKSTIVLIDWVKMISFWFLMIAIRAIMVITFYPILKRTGYGLKKREMIVLIYGGLRGALGLCLSLIVSSTQKLSVRFKELTVFYMCGMAMLTIIVNGLTCGKVVNFVQMVVYPEAKKKLFVKCAKDILHSTRRRLKVIKNDPTVVYADWKNVETTAEIRKIGDIQYELGFDKESLVLNSYIKSNDFLSEIRFRFSRHLKKIFWSSYQKSEISQNSVHILTETCEIMNDNCVSEIDYFNLLMINTPLKITQFLMKFKNWPIIGSYIGIYSVKKMFSAYQLTTSFILAAQQGTRDFQNSFPFKNEQVNLVIGEVRSNIEQAVLYVAELQHKFPTIIKSVHTLKASIMLLKHKQKKLYEMYVKGFIDEGEYQELRALMDKDIIDAKNADFEFSEVNPSQILTECFLFSKLPAHQFANLKNQSKQKIFGKDTVLVQQGKSYDHAYFIISGVIQEQFEEEDFYFLRGAGSFINPYDFTYEESSKAWIQALTDTKVIEIKPDIIFQFINKYDDFRQKWFKKIFPYSLKLSKISNNFEKSFTSRELSGIIEESEIITVVKGTPLQFESGGFIFQGSLFITFQSQFDDNWKSHNAQEANFGQQKQLRNGDFIPSRAEVMTLSNSIIMKFKKILNLKKAKNQVFFGSDSSDDSS